MVKHICIGLILGFAVLVPIAYSPAVFAKDHSSSNSDDKKKDDDQNDQNKQKSSSQSFQKVLQGSQNKQGKFDSSQQSNKSPQWQNFQKQPQWQNFQKQNGQQQGVQKFNGQNNWVQQSHKDHKEINNYVAKFGGPQPFSAQWYKDHPKAWHRSHRDHDDAWKVVTAAGVLGFLGWEVYHPRGPVVVYRPVPYDTLFVTRPGVIIDPSRGDWMPLGTYSLLLGPADYSTRMLDLAVDRFGHIRGSYCDMISGASYNVAGIVDPRTQYAQWSLESNRQLTFLRR